jgi:hypothetical protein
MDEKGEWRRRGGREGLSLKGGSKGEGTAEPRPGVVIFITLLCPALPNGGGV